MIYGFNDKNLKPENLKKGVVLLNTVGTYESAFKLELQGHFTPGIATENTRSGTEGADSLFQINDHKTDPNKKVIRVSTNGFVAGSSVPTLFDHVSYGEIDLTTGVIEMKGSATAEANSQVGLQNTRSFVADYLGESCHYFTRAGDDENGNFNRFLYRESTNEVIQFIGYEIADYNPTKSFPKVARDDIFGLDIRIGNTYTDVAREVDGEALTRFTVTASILRG